MSLQDSLSEGDPAMILAAQDDFSDSMASSRTHEQEMPGSPTLDEWEVVPDKSEPSDCGSSAKSVQMDDSSTHSPDVEDMPTLHVRLTPQGSTNVTVLLTALEQAGPPPQTPSGLSDSARQQYQEQLRKAQETMLPQSTDLQGSRHTESTAVPENQQSNEAEELEAPSDTDLPTSTHMSMQDDTFDRVLSPVASTGSLVSEPEAVDVAADAAADDEADILVEETDETAHSADVDIISLTDTASQSAADLDEAEADDSTHSMTDADSATAAATHPVDEGVADLLNGADLLDEADPLNETESAAAADGAVQFSPAAMPFPVFDSTGELSFMSDGSFINIEDAMPEEEEANLVEESSDGRARPGQSAHAVSADELTQQASDIADAARQLSEEMKAEEQAESAAALDEDSKCQKTDDFPEFQKYSKPNGEGGIQYRLGQLLSTIQTWTASAYASLPTSAAMYNSTLGILGPKSPLRTLDRLHITLASGLALVSAALGWYIVRNQQLQKQVTSSSTELSRLLLKVINLQQSMQSPGRVPVIRHTSSIASVTPFPLMHLM